MYFEPSVAVETDSLMTMPVYGVRLGSAVSSLM